MENGVASKHSTFATSGRPYLRPIILTIGIVSKGSSWLPGFTPFCGPNVLNQRLRDYRAFRCSARRSTRFPTKDEMTVREESRLRAYFFSSTTRLWISAFPVFSTATDSASRHHTSPAFLVEVVVFPSAPVNLAVPGVIA